MNIGSLNAGDIREMSFQNVIDHVLKPAGVKVGGYPDDIFMDLTDDEREKWICNICFQLAREAHECQNKHLFCNTCVFAWSMTYGENSQLCPMCRCSQPVYQPVEDVDRLMADRRIKCPEKNCTFQAPLKVYLMHNHGRERFGNKCTDLESLRPQRPPMTQFLVVAAGQPSQRVRQLRDQLSQGRLMLHQMMMLLHLEMQLRQQALNGFTAATEPHTRLQRLDEVLALNEQLNEVGTILSVLLSTDPSAAVRGAGASVELTARRVPPITASRMQAPPPHPIPIPSPRHPRQAEYLGSTTTQDSSENDEDDSDSGDSEVSVLAARRIRERGITINTAGADQVAVTSSTPGATLSRLAARRLSSTLEPSLSTGNQTPRAEDSAVPGERSAVSNVLARESPRVRNPTNQLGINHAAVANNMRMLRRDPERNALREPAPNAAAVDTPSVGTGDAVTPRRDSRLAGGTTLPALSLPALSPRRLSVSSSISQAPSDSLDADGGDGVLPSGSITHQLTMQELAAVRVAQGGAASRAPTASPANLTSTWRADNQTTADTNRPIRGAAMANSVARRSVPLDSHITAARRDSVDASQRREPNAATDPTRDGDAPLPGLISDRTLTDRPSLSRQLSERPRAERPSWPRQQIESPSVSRQISSEGARGTTVDTSNVTIRELPPRPTSRSHQRRSYDLGSDQPPLRRATEDTPENPYRRLSMPSRDINSASTGSTAPSGSQVNHRARARRAASISSATSRRDQGTAANNSTAVARSSTRVTVGRSTSQGRQSASGPTQSHLPSTSGQLLRARRRTDNAELGTRPNRSPSTRR